MGYYRDFDALSLEEYQAILENADLLPSRRVLQEHTAARFAALKAQGLATVADLQTALKNKAKLQAFALQSELDEDYLAVLIREVNSLQPKPNKLADIPDVSVEVVSALAKLGIKQTVQLFERVRTPADRAALAAEAGMDETAILHLAKLTDLSRIRWVNHTFAAILLAAGYESAADVAQANPQQLHADVKRVNEERGYFKGQIGLHDMALTVNAAKDVGREMVW
ncbi:MAG: DUF4332 domain-containing protein [Anaerolineaceae bacterium]|nr:DUF4332 domain-containing protein [Anaerolineaceae bacterium]